MEEAVQAPEGFWRREPWRKPGWVDNRSRFWTETLGESHRLAQQEISGAAVEMQKEWMGSCSLLQKGRNRRRLQQN